MARVESERAVKHILFDVLETCAKQMDISADKKAYQPVAYAVHAALEDFERQFAKPRLDDRQHQQLVKSAQDMALEWLLTIQDLRRESLLPDGLETLPTWDAGGPSSALINTP